MTPHANIDYIITMYFEGDRSSVRKRYDGLFEWPEEAAPQTRGVPAEEQPVEDEAPRRKRRACEEFDLDKEFQSLAQRITPADWVREELLAVWEETGDLYRPVVAHYLMSVEDPQWTLEGVFEGLLNFFGAFAASHVIHANFPERAFPIDAARRYRELRTILSILGVQFEDGDNLLPVEIARNITNALEEFRAKRGLAHWQVWALVYDLGPRLLPEEGPYPSDPPPRIWLTAAGPANFEHVDRHTETDRDTWSINKNARRGDLVLMYCLAPRSAIVAAYRCGCDAYRDPFGPEYLGIWTELADKLAIPSLPLKEMRADSVLSGWSLVKTSFQGLNRHQVPADIWQGIKQIVAAKDPETGRLLEQHARSAEGVRVI